MRSSNGITSAYTRIAEGLEAVFQASATEAPADIALTNAEILEFPSAKPSEIRALTCHFIVGTVGFEPTLEAV
jgi:hypothetical protein